MTTNGPRASGRPAGEDDVVARVHARRERHRRRPLAVRALALIAGGLLAAIGVVLVIPLPEAGVPALLGGLGLLALEFAWAAAALIRVEQAWQRFKRRRSRPGSRSSSRLRRSSSAHSCSPSEAPRRDPAPC